MVEERGIREKSAGKGEIYKHVAVEGSSLVMFVLFDSQQISNELKSPFARSARFGRGHYNHCVRKMSRQYFIDVRDAVALDIVVDALESAKGAVRSVMGTVESMRRPACLVH